MKTNADDSAKKPKSRKGIGGKPTVMTQETLTKLEYAFSIGATDREACLFAEINPDTLYEYQKKNPKFAEKKEALKEKPIFQARQAVIKQFQAGDGELALKYLSKKKRDEFGDKMDLGIGLSSELQEALDKVSKIFPN